MAGGGTKSSVAARAASFAKASADRLPQQSKVWDRAGMVAAELWEMRGHNRIRVHGIAEFQSS